MVGSILQLSVDIQFFKLAAVNQGTKGEYLKELLSELQSQSLDPTYLHQLNFLLAGQVINHIIKNEVFTDPIFKVQRRNVDFAAFEHLEQFNISVSESIQWSIYAKSFHQGRHFNKMVSN